MLSDSSISRIAVALSIIGLLLLAFQQLPQAKTVAEAMESKKGTLVEIRAKISWARQSGQSIVFELNDGNKITAFFSGSDSTQIALIKPNALVRATGTVSGKKGKELFMAQGVNAVD